MNTTCLPPLAHELLAKLGLTPASARGGPIWPLASGLALAAGLASPGWAAGPAAPEPAGAAATTTATTKRPAASAAAAKSIGEQVREAVDSAVPTQKRLSLVINGKEKKYITLPAKEPSPPAEAPAKGKEAKAGYPGGAGASANAVAAVVPARRGYRRVKSVAPAADTAALAGQRRPASAADWSYEGANGPPAWDKLRPDFHLCASGQRQSPINIDESATLQGPAEPLQFNYQPSSGSVVNQGHTIRVDLAGDNALTVRGARYKLVEFHFHHPAEERVNGRAFAMVAHLVHRNDEGQLAVLAVLLEPGAANALIHQVWTYMPLDAGDRVHVPTGLIDLNELLPKDQRYYQFMGSLSTPPCTEGVLSLVLKQPTSISAAQLKLFAQLFPHNARPLQAVNGRAVRDAQ